MKLFNALVLASILYTPCAAQPPRTVTIGGYTYSLKNSSPCNSESYKVETGKKFVIISYFDEEEYRRESKIFHKNGSEINLDTLQSIRRKFTEFWECCIYVKELNGELISWDLTLYDEPYDCWMDSQTGGGTMIPRYYTYNVITNTVKTTILKKPCSNLIQGGKIICR